MDMPVFVKIDQYEDSLKTLGTSREKLTTAKDLLDRLSEVRSRQEAEMQQLRHELAVIESKIGELEELFRHAQ